MSIIATLPGGAAELVLTRILRAPRPLVFQAWIDPKEMARWWGPKGFTNPICDMDVRPGGAMHIVMRAPDGAEYPCGGTFREITEPERLVFTTWVAKGEAGASPLIVLNTVTFEDLGGSTKLTLRAELVQTTAEAAAPLSGMQQGWSQSLDRLESLVTAGEPARKGSGMEQRRYVQGDSPDREIAIMRLFDAPRELVFKAWTKPEHLAKWWGPTGFATTTHAFDMRAGGTWRFTMHGPDGVDYPNLITYEEIAPPERLVYSHGGGEEPGPSDFHVTIMFAAEGKKTRLTMLSVFPTAAARDHVVKEFRAIEGGNQTLGRLGEFLAAGS